MIDKRAEMKRTDISPTKLYLAKYNGIWLIGRFQIQWYGWNFVPNLGMMNIQYDSLEELHEIELEQKKAGDSASHIFEYVANTLEKEEEDD